MYFHNFGASFIGFRGPHHQKISGGYSTILEELIKPKKLKLWIWTIFAEARPLRAIIITPLSCEKEKPFRYDRKLWNMVWKFSESVSGIGYYITLRFSVCYVVSELARFARGRIEDSNLTGSRSTAFQNCLPHCFLA